MVFRSYYFCVVVFFFFYCFVFFFVCEELESSSFWKQLKQTPSEKFFSSFLFSFFFFPSFYSENDERLLNYSSTMVRGKFLWLGTAKLCQTWFGPARVALPLLLVSRWGPSIGRCPCQTFRAKRLTWSQILAVVTNKLVQQVPLEPVACPEFRMHLLLTQIEFDFVTWGAYITRKWEICLKLSWFFFKKIS